MASSDSDNRLLIHQERYLITYDLTYLLGRFLLVHAAYFNYALSAYFTVVLVMEVAILIYRSRRQFMLRTVSSSHCWSLLSESSFSVPALLRS